jgi:hypothetical protein
MAIATTQPDRTANIGGYSLTLTFPSGKKRSVSRIGEVLGGYRDVARLEVSAKDLKEGEDYAIVPTVDNALDELPVHTGADVIAVGTPFDQKFAGTQTFGKISSLRVLDDPEKVRWIQHDATMTGGNSGGPLFLKYRNQAYWIGINTRVIEGTSMGFAIASEEAVTAEYKWASADAKGAASLLRSVHQIAATPGKSTFGRLLGVKPRTSHSPWPIPDQTTEIKPRGGISGMAHFLAEKTGLPYFVAIGIVLWFLRLMTGSKAKKSG